jgi:molybdate transport system substrate-binding protein
VAASLAEVVTARCADFAARAPGVRCVINSGGSGVLARQIEQGAPVDLFVSANGEWIDYLRSRGLLDSASIAPLVGNRLVFVGTPGPVTSLGDLPRLRRIALGNPTSVPAGAYAAAALRKVGYYDDMQRAGQLVFAQDVRQAAVYAERGEVDGAFVYRSDALRLRRIAILFEVPGEFYPPIVVSMALTTGRAASSEARAFWKDLQSPESLEAFAAAGFTRP